MTDAFCPLCGHEWRRHDPEDGCCDAHSNERLGVCECGRDMAWMHHKIAALSRAALSILGEEYPPSCGEWSERLAGVGEAHPTEPLQNPDCDFIRRGDFNDCAHAGGGRGAKDGWCASCVGRLREQLDAARQALEKIASTPVGATSGIRCVRLARAALGVEGPAAGDGQP